MLTEALRIMWKVQLFNAEEKGIDCPKLDWKNGDFFHKSTAKKGY